MGNYMNGDGDDDVDQGRESVEEKQTTFPNEAEKQKESVQRNRDASKIQQHGENSPSSSQAAGIGTGSKTKSGATPRSSKTPPRPETSTAATSTPQAGTSPQSAKATRQAKAAQSPQAAASSPQATASSPQAAKQPRPAKAETSTAATSSSPAKAKPTKSKAAAATSPPTTTTSSQAAKPPKQANAAASTAAAATPPAVSPKSTPPPTPKAPPLQQPPPKAPPLQQPPPKPTEPNEDDELANYDYNEINEEDVVGFANDDDDKEEEREDDAVDQEFDPRFLLDEDAEGMLVPGAGPLLLDGPVQDFVEGIEPFFQRAVSAIERERFDLACAKDFVMKLRALRQRKLTEGVNDMLLEPAVLYRALDTVEALVNEVNHTQSELYDPRQTLAYLFCAMSVSPLTVRLGKRSNDILFHLSPSGNACFPQISELFRYCGLKTRFEGAQGWRNLISHQRMLLDLAAWLDVDRPVISYLIANKIMPGLAVILNTGPEIQHLWEIGLILQGSALVRCNMVREARDLHRLLMKVDTTRLTPALAARHAVVYAKLLQNCGEFAKALERACDALKGVTDREEKAEIEQLIQQLNDSLRTANLRRFGPKALDQQWLTGAHITPTATRTSLQDAILESHRSHSKKKRRRTKSVRRRGDTPSPAPSARGSISDVTNDVRARLSSFSSVPDLSLRRRLDSTSSVDTASQGGDSFSDETSLIYPSDLDDSDDYGDDEEDPEALDRDILFVDDYSDDHDDGAENPSLSQQQRQQKSKKKTRKRKSGSTSKADDAAEFAPEDREAEEKEVVEKDWFEQSDRDAAADAPGNRDDEEEENIELSNDAYVNRPEGGGGRPPFYPDLLPRAQAEQLLKTHPHRYKRCSLKIERAHKSIAKVLDKDKYSEIVIEGRSKAGRCYMDDEVVVEIIAEPGMNGPQGFPFPQQARGNLAAAPGGPADRSLSNMVYGKVVGFLKRVNYADVDHPVLFCTLDEVEGHLMRPLCKTVPKIHVMHDIVKNSYRTLLKHRVEIKRIKDGKVIHQRFCDVRPDMREQYVFRVAILGWRQRTIYPFGAVLDAHLAGRSYTSGLKVLSMQQRVPKLYPRTVVNETKALAQQTVLPTLGREDLTGERVFTIDPPGSKDLDDAISLKKNGQNYVIGVHIADVAAAVSKGSAVDEEARRRAVTFYPLDRKPRPMLPEPLSHGTCSLLPEQARLAISVFFTFDDSGHKVCEPDVKRTIIKSCCQLTYEEVQKVIDGKAQNRVPPAVCQDILQIHRITAKLRQARQKASMFFVPFDDPRLQDMVREISHGESHFLIEELMIEANTHIARRLTRKPRFQSVMMVRSHQAPSWEDLREWQEKEGGVTNLVLQLQGKKVTPSSQLSLDNVNTQGAGNAPVALGRGRGGGGRGGGGRGGGGGGGVGVLTAPAGQGQETVVVQSEIWSKLCQHLQRGQVDEARQLAFADSLHPLQCLAANHWMDMMETAEYKCYHGLNGPDLRHFGLDVDVYCHFTSPIRRYADLHVHRLIHADLDGRSPDVSTNDVVELCHRINGATSRQRAFGKGCLTLKICESLMRQPLVFRAFVDQVDTEQISVVVPSLLRVSDRKQNLSFSMLGVSSQPELSAQLDKVTVAWKKRVYDEEEKCPDKMKRVWDTLEKHAARPTGPPPPPGDPKKKKNNALVLYISADQHLTKHVQQREWAHIVKTLATNSNGALPWNQIPVTVIGPALLPASFSEEAEYKLVLEVEYMTSEKGKEKEDMARPGDRRNRGRQGNTGRQGRREEEENKEGRVLLRPTVFKRVYSAGQVVQIQMSAEPKKGMLMPRVEMLHVTRNACMCTPHVSEPVLTLTTYATKSVRDRQFGGYADYARDWMPLLEMEAAVEAGNSDGGVVIENVPVTMKTQSASSKIQYRGTFKLKAQFCFERCIDFGGKTADTIDEKKEGEPDSDCSRGEISFPLDYLCLRYKTQCSEAVVSRIKESGIPETVDKDYTWLAHGSVVKVNHMGRREKDGGHLVVTFVLSPSSPPPPPQLLTRGGARITMEILPKSEVDRRCQEMLLELGGTKCELARAIAFGSKIPPLDKDHLMLGKKAENQEINEQYCKLERSNGPQLKAVQMALTNSLSLIQGPPGTGKTNTGIKLVYLFCKINRQLREEGGKKKTVLYCGPSNKSVDLVARELKRKLGEHCPKIVRMYGSAIERKDYPVPRGDLRSSRNMRDLASDKELTLNTLHHVIRESDKPHAEEIGRFDRYFEKCIQEPDKFSVTSKELKAYRKLITKASIEELKEYEVVLTTCSVGGNRKMIEGTGDSIFQVIIDECAMSTEPQSMVPIVATRAQQVVLVGDHKQLRPIIKCQPAAELGLDQSLFERLFNKFPAFTVFLSKQYRMHPCICAFPSQKFYKSKLETEWSILWTGDPLPFWIMIDLANVVPRVVPHLLASILMYFIFRKREVPYSVAPSMVNHLIESGFLSETLGGMLKPFLFRDTIPGRLAKHVRDYAVSGEEMDFDHASQLRTYLADERIVPRDLNFRLLPYLPLPRDLERTEEYYQNNPFVVRPAVNVPQIPKHLGRKLMPYLTGIPKVIPQVVAERLLPVLKLKRIVPTPLAKELIPLLKRHPLLESLVHYLEIREGVPYKFANQLVPSLLALQAIPHVLVDVRGEEGTLTVSTDEGNERSKSNALEADKAIEILGYLKQVHGVKVSSVKILTQYNAQRHLIETTLKDLCSDRSQNTFDRTDMGEFRISTVVSSQGGEWDYVILSTVRSLPSYMIEPNPTHGWCRQNLGFITDRNQVNVALTRARKGLIIIGNVELLRCDDVWRKLIQSYEEKGCLVSDPSQIPPPPPQAPRPQHPRRRQPNATDRWQRVTPASSFSSIPSQLNSASVASLDAFE